MPVTCWKCGGECEEVQKTSHFHGFLDLIAKANQDSFSVFRRHLAVKQQHRAQSRAGHVFDSGHIEQDVGVLVQQGHYFGLNLRRRLPVNVPLEPDNGAVFLLVGGDFHG